MYFWWVEFNSEELLNLYLLSTEAVTTAMVMCLWATSIYGLNLVAVTTMNETYRFSCTVERIDIPLIVSDKKPILRLLMKDYGKQLISICNVVSNIKHADCVGNAVINKGPSRDVHVGLHHRQWGSVALL